MADAHGLGPCVRKDVGVRLLSPAQKMLILVMAFTPVHIHKTHKSSLEHLLFLLIPALVFLAAMSIYLYLR